MKFSDRVGDRGAPQPAAHDKEHGLTVVLDRRPPSPSIQTSESGRSVRGPLRKRGETLLTLCLDLVALGEGEEGREEGLVVGHDGVEQGWNGRDVVGG